MINIRKDENRKWEDGQWWIEIVTFDPTNLSLSGKFGYWCDMMHIREGILRVLIEAFPEQVKQMVNEYYEKSDNNYVPSIDKT